MVDDAPVTFLDEKLAQRWMERVNVDREFALVSRWTDVSLELRCDGAVRRYAISAGRMTTADVVPDDRPAVVMEGSASAWSDYLLPVPTAPNHHVLGMDKLRDDFAIVEGHHVLVQNLRVLALVLALLRSPRQVGGNRATV